MLWFPQCSISVSIPLPIHQKRAQHCGNLYPLLEYYLFIVAVAPGTSSESCSGCFSHELVGESSGDLPTAGDSRAAFLPLQIAANTSNWARNPCSFSNISLTKWDSEHGPCAPSPQTSCQWALSALCKTARGISDCSYSDVATCADTSITLKFIVVCVTC